MRKFFNKVFNLVKQYKSQILKSLSTFGIIFVVAGLIYLVLYLTGMSSASGLVELRNSLNNKI